MMLLISSVLLLFEMIVVNSQIFHYFRLKGSECKGDSIFNISDAPNSTYIIKFDFSSIYKSGGWSKRDSNLLAQHEYNFTLCGNLVTKNSSCPGTWCYQEVNMTDEDDCLAGIAKWDDTVEYFVFYNSTTETGDPHKPIGLGATVRSTQQYGNISCPNNKSTINYNLLCENVSTVVYGVYQNYSGCLWNVTYHTRLGCVTATKYEYPDNDDNDDEEELSPGTIFIIILVIAFVAYMIIGCAYNSFYHGRVGIEAIPNKNSWDRCFRYIKAGCQVTKDTLCCATSRGGEFQNLSQK